MQKYDLALWKLVFLLVLLVWWGGVTTGAHGIEGSTGANVNRKVIFSLFTAFYFSVFLYVKYIFSS